VFRFTQQQFRPFNLLLCGIPRCHVTFAKFLQSNDSATTAAEHVGVIQRWCGFRRRTAHLPV